MTKQKKPKKKNKKKREDKAGLLFLAKKNLCLQSVLRFTQAS